MTHRGKTTTVAEFRRMWLDPAITVDDIAAALGLSKRSVQHRAKHRGMPPRWAIAANARTKIGTEIADMWAACVSSKDIAAYFGVSENAVQQHVHRHGLVRGRPVTRWSPPISMDDYRQTLLLRAMSASAAETRGAMMMAEMVDGKRKVRAG